MYFRQKVHHRSSLFQCKYNIGILYMIHIGLLKISMKTLLCNLCTTRNLWRNLVSDFKSVIPTCDRPKHVSFFTLTLRRDPKLSSVSLWDAPFRNYRPYNFLKKTRFFFFLISLKNVVFLKVMVQSDLRFISHPQILPFTEWTSKPVISLSMF